MKRPWTSPNLTQSTMLNAASSLLNYGAGIVVVLLLSPFLLTQLGPTLFGTWKVCQRLLTYVSATDGRASQALKWTIANRRSVSSIEQKQQEIGCALVVWLRFLPLMLLAGGLLSWFSPNFIRGLPSEYHLVTRLTCAILVLNLLLHPLKSIPESVMVGMNLGYKTTWINAFSAIVGGVLMAGAVWIGWGLIGLASAFLVVSIIHGLAILYMTRKCLPWLAVRRPEQGEVSRFFSFSIWVLAWTFINKFLLASDIVILGLVSSAPVVAAYTLTFYAIQTSVNLSAILVSSGMPGMGDIVGRGELKKAAAVRSEIMTSSWLLAMVIGTLILLWNRPFIVLWVGAEQFVGYGENFLMVMLMTQLIFIRNDAFIVDVTLEIRTKVLLGALSTAVSLGLAILLGAYWQSSIAGVLIGLIAGRSILSVLYPTLVRKSLRLDKEVSIEPTTNVIRLSIVMVVLFASAYYLAQLIKVNSWFELIYYAAFSSLFIFCIVFWIGFSGNQRRKMVFRARQIAFKR
jgi:O-antigen/teichoic acid export membrane protein